MFNFFFFFFFFFFCFSPTPPPVHRQRPPWICLVVSPRMASKFFIFFDVDIQTEIRPGAGLTSPSWQVTKNPGDSAGKKLDAGGGHPVQAAAHCGGTRKNFAERKRGGGRAFEMAFRWRLRAATIQLGPKFGGKRRQKGELFGFHFF